MTNDAWRKRAPKELAKLYSYRVEWSQEDEAFLVSLNDWPGLMGHGPDHHAALAAGLEMVEAAIETLRETGSEKDIPEPLTMRTFNGKVLVRMSPELHRTLALRAAREGKALNTLIVGQLSNGG